MKKVIRLTESELSHIIKNSVARILKEDVLGNNWHENEDENDIYNNYEPFQDQKDNQNQYNWGVQGEDGIDPTDYNQDDDVLGWNNDEAEGYEEDPDWYRDDVSGINYDPSDGDLYRGGW